MSLVPGELPTLLTPLLEVEVPSWKEGSFRGTVSLYENLQLQQTDTVFGKKKI